MTAQPPLGTPSVPATRATVKSLIDNGLLQLGKNPGVDPGARLDFSTSLEPIVLGDNVTIGPGAIICGGCLVGDETRVEAHALLRDRCRIAARCLIETGCSIGPDVEMGDDNTLYAQTFVRGPLTLGSNNELGPFAALGRDPQHRGKGPGAGTIVVGNGNVIREYVTVHQPTEELTLIGDNCYIMAQSHLNHDTIIEDDATVSSGCQLGGHVRLMRGANLGLSCSVHQFTVIGAGAMVGMGSVVIKDVPPHTMAVDGAARKVNRVGLERAGKTAEEIAEVLRYYESIYRPGDDAFEAGVAQIAKPWLAEDVARFFGCSRRPKMPFKPASRR